MIQLLQRSGINEKKSVLACMLLGKEVPEDCGVKLNISAGISSCLLGNMSFPGHVVLRGSLRSSETNLAFLDYIDTEYDNVNVLALTNAVLLRMTKEAATTYFRQYQKFFATLVGSANQLLRLDLSVGSFRSSLRLVRVGEHTQLLEERQLGRTALILLEGSCEMRRRVECLSAQKNISVVVQAHSKHYLLGEEALYDLPYRFSYRVSSKCAFLLEVYISQLILMLPKERLAEMKQASKQRFDGVTRVQKKLMEFPCEKLKPHQSLATDQPQQRESSEGLRRLKTSFSHTNFKGVKQQSAMKVSEATNHDEFEEEPLKFYFEDNTSKVRFELINKGYHTVEPVEAFLKRQHRPLDVKRLRPTRTSQVGASGKEYLVPIMAKLKLKKCALPRHTRS